MKSVFPALILLGYLVTAIPASLADFDVDEADSLDFGGFHEKDDERRKLWEEKKQTTESKPQAPIEKIQSREPLPSGEKGSATQTLDRLYRKMQTTCPQGWDQLREWAAVDNGVIYLYKEFRCRTKP